MRRRVALVALVAIAAAFGCVLDFEQFRASVPGDATAARDAGIDAGIDASATDVSGRSDRADALETADAVPVDGVDPRCAPPANAEVRLAHMAAGFGVVDLCMRRNTGTGNFAVVRASEWPGSGVAYGAVSQHVSLNAQVVVPNERWQFAVVPKGTDCARVTTINAIATLNGQLGPQSLSTLLLTAETASDGRSVGVLGLLSDQACTSCPANTLDVRAVHASTAAAADRIDLSINYNLPPRDPAGFVNVLFASDIPYGQTAPVGGAGFDCDTAWFGATRLPAGYSVQFGAQAVAGESLARSARWLLKDDLLQQSRMATVFFVGGTDPVAAPPQFVICYEGARDGGMTTCDRVSATASTRPADAGADAIVDAPDATPADVGDASLVDDLI